MRSDEAIEVEGPRSESGSRERSFLMLSNVEKVFGETRVLKDISLSLREGEFFSFLGPSGCGKTTTLRIIGGFERPTAGRVVLDGKDITSLAPNRRPVNTVFQSYALFGHLSVIDNVEFGMREARVPKAERRERAGQALRMVHLGGYENRKPSKLSGGQQQRVALARAIVNRPRLLLLDEPLGSLDLTLRKAMQRELKALQEQVGITFVFVTHDQEEALTMSDRIAVMNAGVLQQVGTPTEIYHRPHSRFVAEFVGSANVLSGRIGGRDGGRWLFSIDGGATVRADGPSDLVIGADAYLIVRPEQCRVGTADSSATVPGSVTETFFAGAYTAHVVTVSGGQRITAYGSELPLPPHPGEPASVSWREDDAWLVRG